MRSRDRCIAGTRLIELFGRVEPEGCDQRQTALMASSSGFRDLDKKSRSRTRDVLERKPRRKLYLPRRSQSDGSAHGACEPSESTGSRRCIGLSRLQAVGLAERCARESIRQCADRVCEVGEVEHVENLSPELEIPRLTKGYPLRNHRSEERRVGKEGGERVRM